MREITKCVVWARAGGRCQYRGCNDKLIGDLISGHDRGKFGLIAHIVAEEPGGPRGDPIRSPLLADDPDNLMLMCYKHHKLIDTDGRDRHPEQLLLDMKAAHERRIEITTGIDVDRASHVLRYAAKIGFQNSPVSFQSVRVAMLPDRYPADGTSTAIEISGNAANDAENEFWQVEIDSLRRQFEARVRQRIEQHEITHLSVFALAPISLLFELGRLLGDIVEVDVYQLHRHPKGWKWANDEPPLEFTVSRGERTTGPVALKLSISASIADARVAAVLGSATSIWELSIPKPGNDVMRSRRDLKEFYRVIRALYADIHAAHPNADVLHIFPAVPVSVAVEAGRAWMPKADLPLQVYEQTAGAGFLRRLCFQQ